MSARPVITHGGTERVGHKCRCVRCGTESTCTLLFDFYTRPGDDKGPLYCHRCIFLVAGEPTPRITVVLQ